jgi:glycosyltransferase involved in cell wall biosynthesis
VQIEAMMNGVPSIASDLPGVRQPVLRHKMGRIIPIGDADALANAVYEIMLEKKPYSLTRADLEKLYAPESIALEYEQLFKRIIKEID